MAENRAGSALAIADVLPPMEESFRKALVEGGIPPILIEFMRKENILSPADLPRYCGTGETGRENIFKYLINGNDETRNQRRLMPCLSKLFEEAEYSNKEEAERKAKGLVDEEIERPLPDHDKTVGSMNDRHYESYGFRLSSDELLWPHLFGRVKRERDGDKETMIELDRVGTETEGGVSPGARQMHHGDGLTTSYRSWAGTTRPVPTNFIMMKLWEVSSLHPSPPSPFHLLTRPRCSRTLICYWATIYVKTGASG